MIAKWLALMCTMLPEVRRGLVVQADSADALAVWPAATPAPSDLVTAAGLALTRRSTTVSSAPEGSSGLLIARPLQLPSGGRGAVALDLQAPEERLAVIRRLLDWGQAWLTLLGEEAAGGRADPTRALAIITEALEYPSADDASSALATALARDTGLQRVCIGRQTGPRTHLAGVSYSAGIDTRTDLGRTLHSALSHCLENPGEHLFSAAAGDLPPRLEELLATERCGAAIALPLGRSDGGSGVLLGLARGDALDPGAAELCRSVARLAGPVLETRAGAAGRPIPSRLSRLIHGPGPASHGRRALGAAVLLATVAAGLALLHGEHRVTAKAKLEGRVQRAIVAPVDGYLIKAPWREGAHIASGELIAELDDREISLEHQRWLGQREEYSRQYHRELAKLDHSQMRIYQAQVAQADARLRLLEEQLERVHIRSPIDGVIIQGDLSRSLGAPVERGEVLFEIAPLDDYRLVLEVPEEDVVHVRQGQTGTLQLTSLPAARIPFTIEQVSPVFRESEGRITYRTVARLDRTSGDLRPGMGGYGKIRIGERSYGWIWFHDLANWLRLRLWSLRL